MCGCRRRRLALSGGLPVFFVSPGAVFVGLLAMLVKRVEELVDLQECEFLSTSGLAYKQIQRRRGCALADCTRICSRTLYLVKIVFRGCICGLELGGMTSPACPCI